MLDPRTLALKAFTSLPLAAREKLGMSKGWTKGDLPGIPSVDARHKNLLIGPTNSAGQAYLWAKAASQIPGWTGWNISYLRSQGFSHASDYVGLEKAVVHNPKWAKALRDVVASEFAAVIVESLLPLFGSVHFQDATREIRYLQRRGVKVAVLWHGSDIRDPAVHRANTHGSVFFDAPAEALQALEATSLRNARSIERLDVQVFVSTPDLLRFQPKATWLPLMVQPEFLLDPLVFRSARPPIVLHLPSRGYLKGTAVVSGQMNRLARTGAIRYCQPDRVDHREVRRLLEGADIVIDQIGMDAYGVATLEALALGKTVVGQVGDFVRRAIRTRTGLDLPVQEADELTLTKVVEQVAADDAARARLACEGRKYVEEVHSAEAVSQAMRPYLEGQTT